MPEAPPDVETARGAPAPGEVARVLGDRDRLAAVLRTGLLDSEPEEVFDRLTRLAARLTGAPVTFVSVVEEGRDFYKSCFGFEEPLASERQATGTTFCHYAIVSDRPLVIPDTRADPAYRQVPTVDSMGVAAYLGIPLKTAGGQVIGSFCAVDFVPREWTERDVMVVSELAESTMREVELRSAVRELDRAREDAERRAIEEEALRRAAEAVTATFTVAEVSAEIARSALAATEADGAFVERIDIDAGETVVLAAAGARVPALGARVPYHGSFAQESVERREAILIRSVDRMERPLAGDLARTCARCSALVIPLLDAGEPIGALVLLRTEEKRFFHVDEVARAYTFGNLASLAFHKIHLLEDAQKKREELEKVTESRARLVRGFSHDLKNPLGAADGHAQLLEDGIVGELAPAQKESVGRIRSLLASALELIDDLVELARVEAGQVTIEEAPTDVRDLTEKMMGEYRAQVEAAGLALECELPERFPVVRSDPRRVRQVLGNLISNAIKYNREGGRVAVRVELRDRGPLPGARWAAVDVADTGPGIPADKRHLIFREFTRLDPQAKHGAGLGLAISRRIAHALGGEITFRSGDGEGTTFTLWIPCEGGEPAGASQAHGLDVADAAR